MINLTEKHRESHSDSSGSEEPGHFIKKVYETFPFNLLDTDYCVKFVCHLNY